MNALERQKALETAKAGDTEALGQLLNSFRPYLRVLLRSVGNPRLRSRLDDSDLIQDALLEAHRNFADFRGTTSAEFVGWLRQIILRTVSHATRDHLGAAKRSIHREEPSERLHFVADVGESPSDVVERHEQAALMASALTRLPDDMQQVLLGRTVDDLPYAVLAERLGRSEGAVRVLFTRAVRRLGEEMGVRS